MAALLQTPEFMSALKAAVLFLVLAHPSAVAFVGGLTGFTGTNLLLLHGVVYFAVSYALDKYKLLGGN
jgi:hypothetical protein